MPTLSMLTSVGCPGSGYGILFPSAPKLCEPKSVFELRKRLIALRMHDRVKRMEEFLIRKERTVRQHFDASGNVSLGIPSADEIIAEMYAERLLYAEDLIELNETQ